MADRTERQKVGYEILNTVIKFMSIDKITRNFGTDMPIYHSEIHMISSIAKHPGIHIGGLADHLGITKGAVSEVVKKLERKKLVIKETDKHNLSKLSIFLTEKGKTAYKNHMKYHEIIDKIVEDELKNASNNDVRFLNTFLKGLRDRLDCFKQKIQEQ